MANNNIANLNNNITNVNTNLENIRNRLGQNYNGSVNVPTLYHNIDVLCSDRIIVISELHNWAQGIGLLYTHSTQFPNRNKHLHIYNTQQPIPNLLLNKIISLVNQLNISLSVEQ